MDNLEKRSSVRGNVITAIVTFFVTIILVVSIILAVAGDFGGTFFKLLQIDYLVKNNFFGDTSEIDFDEALCYSYVSQLEDEYATYYPPELSKETFDSFEGDKSGIGITLVIHPENYCYYIINVSDNGPAFIAGICAGDLITAVNGERVTKDNCNTLHNKLSGDVGDTVDITVLRDGKELEITVTYDHYILQTVFYRMIGDIGYINITSFNLRTDEQFAKALKTLQEQGAKAFIFDVRDNLGGTTDSVVEIVDTIVPEGDILSVEYYNGQTYVLDKSDAEELNMPIAVLTNDYTASSAEIFAASIKDYKKGVLVGQKTFGKGIMQQTFMLSDTSAVKFTVARYFTKSGVSYDGIGVEPDYSVNISDYERNYYYLFGDENDTVLQKAIEVLNEN